MAHLLSLGKYTKKKPEKKKSTISAALLLLGAALHYRSSSRNQIPMNFHIFKNSPLIIPAAHTPKTARVLIYVARPWMNSSSFYS